MLFQRINYGKSYYKANKQYGDRIALRFYYRLAISFVRSGKVLDYGCGTHLIKRFKEGYEAWAYDVSSYALESVRVIAPHANICTNQESLLKNQFDLIISLHVLEHVKDPLERLLFFYRILNENGLLIYVVPNVSGIGQKIKKRKWFGYGDPSHISLCPYKNWLHWTEFAGFRILKTGTDGPWDVPYLPFLPLWVQKIVFYPLPAIQVIIGRLILPLNWGESLVVVTQKNSTYRNE